MQLFVVFLSTSHYHEYYFDDVAFLCLDTITGSVLQYVEHAGQIGKWLDNSILQFTCRTVEKCHTSSTLMQTFSSKIATVSPVLDNNLPLWTSAISTNCGSKFPLHITEESSL